MMRRLLAAATVVAATLGFGAPAEAFPGGILKATTSKASSYKFTTGNAGDQLYTIMKCSTLSGGIAYATGPWVSIGVWSTAFCPSGYYRAGSGWVGRD